MTGEVEAFLPGRVVRLSPTTRVATVALRRVGGRGPNYTGQYVSPSEQLAPVTDLRTSRQVGRLVKVDPVSTGAELSLVVGDDSVWQALASGSARVDVQVAFERSTTGDPTGGRVVRVEVV